MPLRQILRLEDLSYSLERSVSKAAGKEPSKKPSRKWCRAMDRYARGDGVKWVDLRDFGKVESIGPGLIRHVK